MTQLTSCFFEEPIFAYYPLSSPCLAFVHSALKSSLPLSSLQTPAEVVRETSYIQLPDPNLLQEELCLPREE